MVDSHLRRFPGADRLVVHADAGRSGRHVRALTGSSDWRRDLLDRAGAATIGIAGSRLLRHADVWPWPECDAASLIEALQPSLPGFRLIGAAIPRQPNRHRLSLLGRSGGTLTVIKVGSGSQLTPDAGAGSLATEAAALRLLEANPLPGIATPLVLATGTTSCPGSSEVIEFVATTSVAIGSQRAAIYAPLRTLTDDLRVRLAELPKPADMTPDATPIHGDLTPWNLRRTPRGLALFDWESAGWGAPGHDLETYRRACDGVRPVWARR